MLILELVELPGLVGRIWYITLACAITKPSPTYSQERALDPQQSNGSLDLYSLVIAPLDDALLCSLEHLNPLPPLHQLYNDADP